MNTLPLLDSRQVAELLKCSTGTVEDYARDGRLPAAKFGEGWVFPAEALMRAINRIAEQEAQRRATPTKAAASLAALKTVSAKRVRPNLCAIDPTR